jgi:GAF domain-containing protein
MLNRRHALKVGKVGIVGFVTGTGQPRIATDVGDDAVFFNNPDLPLTRSEMALPLKIGDEIIGAMDVQSTESNAFSNEDISLFNTLADQVAIAIYNSRLFADTARALAESQALHRQYLRQEWQTERTIRHNRAYRYTPQSLAPSEPVPLAENEQVYQAGEAMAYSESLPDGSTRVSLEVPILLRGEMIGAIKVQDLSPDRVFSNDETQAVRDVAQQVGVALENARLFERTMLRAERERKVLEITSRIRSTNDPQEMLEIAAAEVQRALGATRAQIIFRQETTEKVGRHSPNGGKKE